MNRHGNKAALAVGCDEQAGLEPNAVADAAHLQTANENEEHFIVIEIPNYVTIKTKSLLPRLLKVGAITLGNTIRFRKVTYPEGLLLHELVHIEQFRKLGFVWFMLRYIGEYLKNRFRMSHIESYRAVSFEIEAKEKSGVQ